MILECYERAGFCSNWRTTCQSRQKEVATVFLQTKLTPLRPQIMVPFRGNDLTVEQAAFNRQMSAVRISVEWGFQKILQYFPFVDFKKNMKLLLQPIGAYYICATILTNCHTCLNRSETSYLFDVAPPSLAEYLA